MKDKIYVVRIRIRDTFEDFIADDLITMLATKIKQADAKASAKCDAMMQLLSQCETEQDKRMLFLALV